MRIAHLIEEHRQLEERQGGFPRVTTLSEKVRRAGERANKQVIIEIILAHSASASINWPTLIGVIQGLPSMASIPCSRSCRSLYAEHDFTF